MRDDSQADSPVSRRDSLRALAALPLLAATLANGQDQRNRRAQPAAPETTGPRVALVLGSGSARGFAHIGVIKALEAAKIRPDLIVGSSAGAMIGAFYAAGFTGAQMEELALKVKDIEVVDLNSGSKRGMVTGDTLQNFVNRAIRERTIEQLNIPFIPVATTLRTGELMSFKRGDVGLAVRASCSVPGVFIPPRINEVDYVDGGLVSPVPVRVAREAGADVVIAVDVSSGALNHTPAGIYEQVMHAFDIMGRSLAKLEADQADVVIRPDVGRIASTDFNSRAAFIQIGLAAGTRFVPVIQERIANGRSARRRS